MVGIPSKHVQDFVVAVFAQHSEAELAVHKLKGSQFDIKNFSIVGSGCRANEDKVGFYSMGDRIRYWGEVGAFWGELWGKLVIKYETSIRAGKFLLIAHGTADEVRWARNILQSAEAEEIDVHQAHLPDSDEVLADGAKVWN